MPPVGQPPLEGRVIKVHRMRGHFIDIDEPIVDVQVGRNILTVRSQRDGRIQSLNVWAGHPIHAGETIALVGEGAQTYEVFIAYRRDDAPGHAGRVGERLFSEFGPGQVFKDLESLPPGRDFVDVIQERLRQAVSMVLIIGPRWLTMTTPSGARRLDDPADLHREEIRTVLASGKDVFHVLVQGAHVPQLNDLPDDIRPLARRYALEITDSRWEFDVTRLVQAVTASLWRAPLRSVPTVPYS